MKRRFLILSLLLGSLWVLAPEPQPVLAVCDCYDTYSACLSQAVATVENCLFGAQSAYDLCLSNGGTESVCNPIYQQAAAECQIAYSNAEYSCDQALNSCLAGCGGGGGGSSGSICHDDEQLGYIVSYVSWFAEPLPACISASDGGAEFTAYGWPRDTFDLCMSYSGANQEACCRDQVKANLDAWAVCNVVQHPSSSCKHCISF